MTKQTIMYGHRLRVAITNTQMIDTYAHLYPSPHAVRMAYPTGTIYKLRVEECAHNNPLQPWGWWSFSRQTFTIVHYTSDLVEMCFSCGTQHAEDAGQGIKLPVKIVELEEVPDI